MLQALSNNDTRRMMQDAIMQCSTKLSPKNYKKSQKSRKKQRNKYN